MKQTQSYRCSKCRDITFIVVGDVAVPCECRDIRIAEDILKQSGISKEFRKKTFDNFNYSYDIQVIDAYSKATRYYSDGFC